MRNVLILPVLGWMLLVMSSCEKQEITDAPSSSINPDSIVVEVYQGHTHVSKDQMPKMEDVFWSNTSNGFHADPDFPNYPMKAIQRMVLVRNDKGEYLPKKEGITHFLTETSPVFEGGIYALVLKMYADGGKRLDLSYRSDSLRDRTQVFYQVKNLQPIAQTIPANVTAADTLFTIEQVREEDEALADSLTKAGLKSPFTFFYETKEKWAADMPASKAFYFFYQDKATDDRKDINYFKTPVGFRGVFTCRVPGVQYDVEVSVTDTPTGKPGTPVSSNSPTAQQLNHRILTFKIPFRNIYETQGWGKINGDAQLMHYLYDKDYNDLRVDVASQIVEYRSKFIHVLREYPTFTLKQLYDLYEKDAYSGDSESSNFWL